MSHHFITSVHVNQKSDSSDFLGIYVSCCHGAPATKDTSTEESDSNANQENIDISILQSASTEDIDFVRNQGFDVNVGPEPTPENNPVDGTFSVDDLSEDQALGWDGMDCHHATIPEKEEPSH